MNNPSVVEKLDHVVSMLKQADNRKFDPVLSAILAAKARIQHLETQLVSTETMRDRMALRLLPGILQRHADQAGRVRERAECVRDAYAMADLVLSVRSE